MGPSLLEAGFEALLKCAALSAAAGERVGVVGVHSVSGPENGVCAIWLDVRPVVNDQDFVLVLVDPAAVQGLGHDEILRAFVSHDETRH